MNKKFIKFIPLVVIAVSFGLPFFMEEIDKKILTKKHKVENRNIDISTKATDLTLVKRLREIRLETKNLEEVTSLIEVVENKDKKDEILGILDKLIEEGIIENKKNNLEKDKIGVSSNTVVSVSNLKQYILKVDNQEIILWWDIKIKKALYIGVKGEGNLRFNKKTMLKGYLNYLNLDLLNDWKFEEDRAISEEARLLIENVWIKEENLNYIRINSI